MKYQSNGTSYEPRQPLPPGTRPRDQRFLFILFSYSIVLEISIKTIISADTLLWMVPIPGTVPEAA